MAPAYTRVPRETSPWRAFVTRRRGYWAGLDTALRIHEAPFDRLAPHVLYGILRLRSAIFVVEQSCVFEDMDGRDEEPATRHLWVEDEATVVAALRLLRNRDGSHHIGRVVTDAQHRGQGLGAALMAHAIALAGPPVDIKAQARLCRWYSQFGFVPYGEPFDEEGIEHQRMRLDRS